MKGNHGMIDLRGRSFQSVEVVPQNLGLAASMRLGHAGTATLLRHALAAIVLRCPASIS
jgi:hypothetical protein